MTVWFTSDTHFCHKKVSELRGFARTENHDAEVIRRWNAVVREDDIVWLLGDVGIAKSDTEILAHVARLNGRKQLVVGNHDSVHPANRKARQHQRQWLEVFESVQAFAKTSVCGTDFLMSHFPYEGDRGEDRSTQYRLRDEGRPLLHGHLHCKEKLMSAGRKIVHVGLDAWDMKPVKDVQIKELLESSPVSKELWLPR
jgi:calcineurin-like phosphoesterase family protein